MVESTVPHKLSGLPLKSLRIEVVQGPEAGQRFVASADTITIGTAPGNDVVLSDETVSRYHLELQRRADRIVVRDHGSTNGVLLGNTYLDRATIAPGTVLALGKTSIRVDDGDTVELELLDRDSFGGLRGRTPEMRSLMAKLERASGTDVAALLVGETGTGKELIAQAVHENSARSAKPFQVVDCGALMPTLIASELFGHEKGAFTGAETRYVGAFERAHGGTLFLDEVGELPAALQAALLGALERKSIRRVGGTEPIPVDVRVICATARDLRSEVNAGRFRQDLYYRIAVLLLRVPPLRERAGDIPLLVEHFLHEAGHDGSVEDVIPQNVLMALKSHHWPGNVRELRNFVEAALAMGETPHLDLPGQVEPTPANALFGDTLQTLSKLPYKDARARLLDEFEKVYLEALMNRTKHNVSKASREAKMNRSYLIQILKRHQIR